LLDLAQSQPLEEDHVRTQTESSRPLRSGIH
jgi:hypothetical protein